MAKAKKTKATWAGGKKARPLDASDSRFLELLGAKLKVVRREHEFTAKQLAAAIGVEILSQFKREAGKVTMPVVDLHRYAKALGIPVADLIPPEADHKPRSKSKASAAASSDPKRGSTR